MHELFLKVRHEGIDVLDEVFCLLALCMPRDFAVRGQNRQFVRLCDAKRVLLRQKDQRANHRHIPAGKIGHGRKGVDSPLKFDA